ncbi:ribosome recycling factor, partial [bacterium]|nr:ribosome recycling factor [bacterium]
MKDWQDPIVPPDQENAHTALAVSCPAQKEHGWSEDEVKRSNDEIQKLTDTYTKKIDE